ncbi:hypothetical protein ADUPG1_004596, partial [Aduncisulcus paluster]
DSSNDSSIEDLLVRGRWLSILADESSSECLLFPFSRTGLVELEKGLPSSSSNRFTEVILLMLILGDCALGEMRGVVLDPEILGASGELEADEFEAGGELLGARLGVDGVLPEMGEELLEVDDGLLRVEEEFEDDDPEADEELLGVEDEELLE